MRLPPTVKKLIGYTWAAALFSALFWMIFWKDIKGSDTYQRNFNATQWEQKQQARAVRRERYKELDQIECQVMLRAKSALMPIEIERNELLGLSRNMAEKMVIEEFELDKEMCEKHGIPPSASNSENYTRDDCERYPGIYGC
ncbi:MAG: hypothetical protein A2143_00630 [Gallionellales bacterium RBG_16_57_15]|nr:MAG: hypothetical protein A2143_00630 [Gallionellales bacterium RBG_16_57_15]